MKRRLRLIATFGPFYLIGFIAAVLIFTFIGYLALNQLGPSTEYYSPKIEGATQLPNGKYVAYLGDRIFVTYFVIRHKLNGNCYMTIERMAENIGGSEPGKKHLLDYVELQFVGANELHRPRWPLQGLVLGYDINRKGKVLLDHPIIPPGQDEQELKLYVHARYYCNFVDYIIPRYLQGGDTPDQTAAVRLIVKRDKKS